MFTTNVLLKTLSNLTKAIVLTGLLSSCGIRDFRSPHFDFVKNKDNVQQKQAIEQVPKHGADGWVYFCRRGPYMDRQMVLKNVDALSLYRQAYGVGRKKVVLETSLPEGNYIAEIIIPEKDRDKVYEALQTTVDSVFATHSEFREVEEEVWVLTLDDPSKLKPNPNAKRRFFNADDGKIKLKGLTASHLTLALTNALPKNMLIVTDDTTSTLFDLEPQWEKGNVEDLQRVLSEHGFQLQPEVRAIKKLFVRARVEEV